MLRCVLMSLLAGSLACACAPAYQTTQAELAMTRYAPAPDASAVVLERSARVVLDYRSEADDAGTFKAFGKMGSSGAGGGKVGGSSEIPNSGQAPTPADSMKRRTADLLHTHNVASYTFDLTCRTKILDRAGLARAQVEDVFPVDASLESFAAATLLPDGRVIPVESVTVQTTGGAIRFDMPQAQPGAVIEYRYKYHSRNLASLAGWTFQSDLPVARSAYHLKMLAGTSLPYRFIKTADEQPTDPQENTVLGMDQSQWVELSWELTDLPASAAGQPRAAVLFGD
jgi:hypothetical protein